MRTPQTKISNRAISPSLAQRQTIFKPFTADFKILIDGKNQPLAYQKYYKKSSDVFIESSNPSLVHVKKENITWGDFFKTLPLELTDYCLSLNQNHVYCNGKLGELSFYLNQIETPKALDLRMSPGDSLIIQYESLPQSLEDTQSAATQSAQ
jgi:hypothetical protein